MLLRKILFLRRVLRNQFMPKAKLKRFQLDAIKEIQEKDPEFSRRGKLRLVERK